VPNTVEPYRKSTTLPVRKRQLQRELFETIASLNQQMRTNELLTVAGDEQRQMIEERNKTLALYQWAFSITAGRLFAHQEGGLSVSEFTTQLLVEAQYEMSLGTKAE